MADRACVKDETGELEKIATAIIKEDFPDLSPLRILYAWVDPPEEDAASGRICAGKVRRLSNRDRDLFGFDIAITISSLLWRDTNELGRRKLIWHELYHIMVLKDPECEGPATDRSHLERDKGGRPVIHLRKHDLNLERFEGEIRKFGITDEHQEIDRIAALGGYVNPTATRGET